MAGATGARKSSFWDTAGWSFRTLNDKNWFNAQEPATVNNSSTCNAWQNFQTRTYKQKKNYLTPLILRYTWSPDSYVAPLTDTNCSGDKYIVIMESWKGISLFLIPLPSLCAEPSVTPHAFIWPSLFYISNTKLCKALFFLLLCELLGVQRLLGLYVKDMY